jgi:hypothetical protein
MMPTFESSRLSVAAESFFVATLATAVIAAAAVLLATAFGTPGAHAVRGFVVCIEVAAAVICMLYYYGGRNLCLLPALACFTIALPLVVSL